MVAELIFFIFFALVILLSMYFYRSGEGNTSKDFYEEYQKHILREPIETKQLKSKYIELTRQRADVAEKMIARQLEILTKKYPGHTYAWYLEKMIHDLERDIG